MKTYLFIAVMCLLSACTARMMPVASPVSNTLTNDSKSTPMLLGRCGVSALHQTPFSNWFDSANAAYIPEAKSVKVISAHTNNTVIEIFLGTWCGDSKREVPRLLKGLITAGSTP